MSDSNLYDIKWLPHKKINAPLVELFLSESEALGQYTNGGPIVQRLERLTRDLLEISPEKAVIAVTNGSVALHALAAAIELEADRKLKWATQAFTFPSSVQGSLAGTVIVDIDEGGGLDLTQVPEDVDGIIVTNVFGNVVDINKYEEYAKTHQKYLIFDNAATPYTFYHGKNSINYGVGSIVSFHHTKPIGFGEGGAIIVDTKYEPYIRRIINFGLGGTPSKWHPAASNYKMSDIAAVYILQFLNNFEVIIKDTQEAYLYYKNLLKDTPIRLYPDHSDPDRVPLVSCMCLLHPRFTPEKVDSIIENRIFCRKYYYPLDSRPKCDEFYDQIVCLPCHYQLSFDEIVKIVKLLV